MRWRHGALALRSRRDRRPPTSPAPGAGPPDAGADQSTAVLGGLLRDLAGYRVALDADLTLAAAAAEHDDPRLARDLIEEERRHLALTEGRLLGRLAELEELRDPGLPATAAPTAARPRRVRRLAVRAAPLVGAAATAAAVLTGTLPVPGTGPSSPSLSTVGRQSAIASWTSFSHVAGRDPDAAELLAAADALHQALIPLIASAPNDTAAGHQALTLLGLEQRLLEQDRPAGTDAVLAQTHILLAQLTATLSHATAPVTAVPSEAASALRRKLERVAREPLAVLPLPSGSPAPRESPSPTSTPAAISSSPAAVGAPSPSTSPAARPSPTGTGEATRSGGSGGLSPAQSHRSTVLGG